MFQTSKTADIQVHIKSLMLLVDKLQLQVKSSQMQKEMEKVLNVYLKDKESQDSKIHDLEQTIEEMSKQLNESSSSIQDFPKAKAKEMQKK